MWSALCSRPHLPSHAATAAEAAARSSNNADCCIALAAGMQEVVTYLAVAVVAVWSVIWTATMAGAATSVMLLQYACQPGVWWRRKESA